MFWKSKKTGLESKKVLVIDDPISSMDSNVLFIVSTLVKNVIRNCKENETIGSANMLMNVMRRILEHYFMVIGGIDYEKCINQIEGSDKIICKALISFINDGSHSVFEDLIFAPDDGDIENYKRVFKMVFDKLGHIDHYNMMMSKI